MKYALLIYSEEAPERFNALPEDQQTAILREYMAISELPGTLGQLGAGIDGVRADCADVSVANVGH